MWDKRYSDQEYIYGKQANDFLREVGASIPSGRVLCLCEGEGRNAVYLAERGYSVTAVDASAVGLAKARKLAAERAVEIETVTADLAEFVIKPNSWEGIVSIFCHVPPPLRRRVHQQVVAGLRPGGVFILEAYTPRQLEFKTGGPPEAALTMTLASVKQELQGLEFRHMLETEREVVEGKYHTGRGAVVQLLAVKP